MFKLHNLCLLNEYDPYMLKLNNLLYKQDFCFSFICNGFNKNHLVLNLYNTIG